MEAQIEQQRRKAEAAARLEGGHEARKEHEAKARRKGEVARLAAAREAEAAAAREACKSRGQAARYVGGREVREQAARDMEEARGEGAGGARYRGDAAGCVVGQLELLHTCKRGGCRWLGTEASGRDEGCQARDELDGPSHARTPCP